jgi:hypothetical protein
LPFLKCPARERSVIIPSRDTVYGFNNPAKI